MPAYPDLWSLDDAYEAVASFDVSRFHIFFDARHFPFGAIPSGSNDEVTSSDGDIDWTAALRNVPTPVLAHELAHAMQVATTPAGLTDFYLPFLAENLAGQAINDARSRVTHALPRGLRELFAESGDPSAPYRHAEALEWYRAVRLGGVRFALSETTTLDRFAHDYPDHHFTSRVDENGSTEMALIGARHIYEGFGGSVQRIRSLEAGQAVPDFPFDPYDVYFVSYKRARPTLEGLKGSLYEFAVLLDTALLEDEFESARSNKRLPGTVAFELIGALALQPELVLNSMNWQDVAAFQNEMMRVTGFAVPDVRAILEGLRARLLRVFEEIGSITTLPRNVLDDYRDCIDTLQRFRLEYFHGACPLELLVDGSREWLSALISNIPSGSNGFEPPLTEGDDEHRQAFEYQKSDHWRHILDELVFGPRSCVMASACLLPRRAACLGVTDDLVVKEQRCPRESLIARIISDLRISRLD